MRRDDSDLPIKASALLTVTGAARRETVDGSAINTADADTAEAEREAADAEFNRTIGWIPILGTIYNGASLVADVLELSTAVLAGDFNDIADEIGDIMIDVVGMVPVVGAPLAAVLHDIRAEASTSVNEAPVAVTDVYSVNQDTRLTGNVLANDFDPDGDPLTIKMNIWPSHGSVTLNGDGSFAYTPTAGYNGADTFSYLLTDSRGATTIGMVNITVKYVAPQPPPPPTTPTLSQRVATFVTNTRGRSIANPDGSYLGECVSLVRQYLEQVHNIRTGAWGNAIDYRLGASGGNQLAARGFTWHTDRNFQDGDILVFGQNSQAATGVFGHIGIWHNGQLYDQNNGWRANPRTANYSPYSSSGIGAGLLGYWRPPGGTTGGTTGGSTGATSGTKSGTATVIRLVNVRNDPSTSGPIVAQYSPGQTFNYDSWVIANGYKWVSYVSYSGVRRYVAEATADGSVIYLSGGVFH
jgi:hypothetical protein